MDIASFKKLHAEGLISGESLKKVEQQEEDKLFSLHGELRLLLYLGVLLLTGGMGILVYKNIDSIGHQAVLAFIALVTAGCFFYCSRKKLPFSRLKVNAPDPFFDYVLLLGCLSLLIFLGYLQYQYEVFGHHYGLATFIPMLILFASAYYFDHLGVLSLAITNLAAWAGIAATPLTILKENNFDNDRLIYTGLILAACLLTAGWLSLFKKFKAHFEFTWSNFGLHLLFIAGLAGLFRFDSIFLLWFLVLLTIAFLCYTQAMKRNSFYFVLIIILYSYIALSYVIVQLLEKMRDTDLIFLGLFYFILSAIGLAVLLIRLNRQIKSHAGI